MSNYSSLFRVLLPSRVQTKFEEKYFRVCRYTDIMIFCLVQGDAIKNSFPIDTRNYATFGHLRTAIKDAKQNAFVGIDADRLTLWKVDIIQTKENQEVIVKEHKGVELHSFESVGSYFQETPTSTNISIIVEPPPPANTGLKRPNSESHFQNRRMRKLVKTEGPVDITKNFYVPFDILESTYKLEEAINEKVCVLLVGHFQSGKSSTLHYLSGTKENYFYIQASMLANGFLNGLCDQLSLNLCNNISEFDREIVQLYKKQIVIMIDEFDRFLLNQNKSPVDTIDQMRELIKLVNDRGERGIKSVIFAGSFAITTILENGSHQVKKVIEISSQESSQELPQDNLLDDSLLRKQTQSCLQKPEGVPSPLNSAKIIEASDFTKEQHIQFYYDIQENLNLRFNEKVVDDIYSLTNGYAGLEGLLASLCIQYGSNEETLEFNAWNDLFTEFIRNPTKKKISAVKHIEKYLSEPVNSSNNHFIKDTKKLLERFLRKGTLHSSEINDEDLVAIVHLRAIGIIRDMGNEILGFTSNIILDLLSDNYYPVFRRDALARIPHINSPQDFLSKTLDLFKHIRYNEIFDPLAANQHSFSESTIQGELYALLRMAVSYPTYRIFRETRTLEKSEKKCNVWVCNNKEYGIECKVDKVSEKEIKKAAEQAIEYTKGQDKVCGMFVFNFVPSDSKANNCQLFFPNVIKPRNDIYFETVHILYSKTSRSAQIFRNNMDKTEIPFALS
ncbi:hypothetical protein GLOIN_2v1700674 [Rhizophagus irregularis DAOM 181602=DAOM 197198]|uniref:Crinkler family protein n=1 Tax=Rhizophagus irregularis (strain DAOM 181602 / DAOM 197198 / MUCL 43194) TaxID=747089 RepID=A0A2P4P962_RHIID|nr:hypothetical protein GLOIN_2v1700674 [Rhizophagus irregularis DAOM 181602=DAOM 197198]POG61897.1 hypothetical protein GLOIN_2v1700674 [Rhizophagus irregularis DAOM 181602=DAOM 197198]|eukprot:XP_025168763.1 hypothetical protein GLOIN_2v1700674 [Rhizophagus irregularis DAOM 181602=DAOM 197198]